MIFSLLKYFSISSLRNVPISLNLTLPEASVLSVLGRRSWPAPSATRMTAWPLSCRRFFRSSRRPFSPWRSNGASGMRQKLTSLCASEVWAAMNPLSRPMTFTSPTPLTAFLASMWAQRTTGTAIETAVSNPNDVWMNARSLSIVLGTPTTEIFSPRFLISSEMAYAPFWVPSPPIVKRMLTFMRSRVSTMSEVRSPPPRALPRIVPPFFWISSTTSGSSETGVSSEVGRSP